MMLDSNLIEPPTGSFGTGSFGYGNGGGPPAYAPVQPPMGGAPNVSSYDDDVRLADSELNERGSIERREEQNLSGSSMGQLWARFCVTFFNEFVASFFFYVLLWTSNMTGVSFVGQCILGGVALTGLVSVFGRENAAHLDPLITIMLTICGKLGLPWYYMFAHLLAQPVAGVIGALFVWAMSPGFERGLGLGADSLAFGYTPGQGLCAQILGALIFYSVWLWMTNGRDRRNYYDVTGASEKYTTLFALAVGFTLIAVALGFGAIAGTNFNWYLYFFPRIISGTTDSSNWWLWLVGPPVAAFFGVAIYYFLHWLDNLAYRTVPVQKPHYS